MKSVSRKIISLVLAALMVLSLGVVAFAEEPAVCNFSYELESDETPGIITGYNGIIEKGLFTIEDVDAVIDFPLSSVGTGAFKYDEEDSSLAYLRDVEELVVEEGIEEIGEEAFAYLPALTKVTFKGNVKIAPNAFKNCLLLDTVVFEGNADLDEYAFAGCDYLKNIQVKDGADFDAGVGALNETAWFLDKDSKNDFIMVGTTLIAYTGMDAVVNIPLNVTRIGKSAFEGNANLEKVFVSKYVDTLGDRAFAGCSALTEVTYDDYCDIKNVGADVFVGTPYFEDYDGEFFIIADVLVKYTGDDVAFVVIPNTVKHIAAEAFMGCYKYSDADGYTFVIDAILVPASVEDFGEDCFALVKYEDDTVYSPRVYAYANAKSYEALKKMGYLLNSMNLPGDVNFDTLITAADARDALRIAVGVGEYTEAQRTAADLDKDSRVTAADARTILRIVVGLEGYTSEDLLYKPETTYEVFTAYKNAVKELSKDGKGYMMKVTNTLTSSDVCYSHRDRLEGIASLNSDNNTYLVKAGTKKAQELLPALSLTSTDNIKSATCTYSNGNYVYTIKFNDVVDADLTVNNSAYVAQTHDFQKVISTVSGATFYNALANDKSVGTIKWFSKFVDDSNALAPNCVRKYQLTYTNPTIVMVADKETGDVKSITLSVGYHFAIDARINGLDVSGAKFKVGDATIDRLDTVVYSNFSN